MTAPFHLMSSKPPDCCRYNIGCLAQPRQLSNIALSANVSVIHSSISARGGGVVSQIKLTTAKKKKKV